MALVTQDTYTRLIETLRATARSIAEWDRRVSVALAARRGPFWTQVMVAFSWSGATFVWFSIAGALIWARRAGIDLIPGQVLFLIAMLASLVVLVVGTVLKRVFKRPRPFAANIGVKSAVWAPGKAHSFPSTHTSTSVALTTGLFMLGHPWAAWVAVWTLLVSYSRVYLGVHFASDVLGGAALGIACGLMDWRFLVV